MANIYICLLYTSIEGKDRLTGVVIAEVGPDRKPIPGTEVHYDCDTLLLSCGLIPENELSKQADVAMNPVTNGPLVDESLETNIDGVFACGNVPVSYTHLRETGKQEGEKTYENKYDM